MAPDPVVPDPVAPAPLATAPLASAPVATAPVASVPLDIALLTIAAVASAPLVPDSVAGAPYGVRPARPRSYLDFESRSWQRQHAAFVRVLFSLGAPVAPLSCIKKGKTMTGSIDMPGTGIHEKRIQNFHYFTNTLTN